MQLVEKCIRIAKVRLSLCGYPHSFFTLLQKCEAMNNFNSVMEILAGLSHASVKRLHKLWEVRSQFLSFCLFSLYLALLTSRLFRIGVIRILVANIQGARASYGQREELQGIPRGAAKETASCLALFRLVLFPSLLSLATFLWRF